MVLESAKLYYLLYIPNYKLSLRFLQITFRKRYLFRRIAKANSRDAERKKQIDFWCRVNDFLRKRPRRAVVRQKLYLSTEFNNRPMQKDLLLCVITRDWLN